MENRRSSHRKKKRRGLRIFLLFLLVLAGGAGLYVWNVYHHVDQTTEAMYEEVEKDTSYRESSVTLDSEEPISILLLGVDTGDLGRTEQGRSDSMVVVTVNPDTQKTTMLSIPRDTYTEIVGYGTMDKINHAYAFGGTSMAINTVQSLLNIPVDYYVTVNMAGIKEIVDAVGGVDVVPSLTFTYENYTFYEGETTHLDGTAALAYSRMRYDDPNGDTGRQARQREIIEGVISQVASPSALLNYQDILSSLSSNVQTNLQMSDYLDLQSHNYLAAAQNIQQEQLGGEGGYLNEIYYNFVDETELTRVQGLLRTELELE